VFVCLFVSGVDVFFVFCFFIISTLTHKYPPKKKKNSPQFTSYFSSTLPLSATQDLAARMRPVAPQRVAAALLPADPSHLVTVTVAHLESQLASALALGSPREYHAWMGTYIGYLAREGLESRASEVFSELLGHGTVAWVPTVLGINKRTLLRELLAAAVSANNGFARLATEFTEQLDEIDANE
jgi:hypothetical protein